jgi:hypothetical protein
LNKAGLGLHTAPHYQNKSSSQTSDLALALSRIRAELKVQPDVDFRITVTGLQKPLPSQIQDEIYRIGREALVNAFCHSGAKRIELELDYSDRERVRIHDDGCGIDPQVLDKGRDGRTLGFSRHAGTGNEDRRGAFIARWWHIGNLSSAVLSLWDG